VNYIQFREQLTKRGWALGSDQVWRSPASQQLCGLGVLDSDIANLTSNHGDLLHSMILSQVDGGIKGWSVVTTQNGLQIQTNLQLFF
jgi:hypothetical protein